VIEQLRDIDDNVRKIVEPHHDQADAVAIRDIRKQNQNARCDVMREHHVVILAADTEKAMGEASEGVAGQLKHVRKHKQRRSRLVDRARLPDAGEIGQ
jgi:hypothetical protein